MLGRRLSLLGIVLAFNCWGCGEDTSNQLQLTLSGAEPLKGGFHYEGWAIIDGQPVTTGKFNIAEDGSLIHLDGTAISGGEFDAGVDLIDAKKIVITIEPAGDTDTIPAATHFLAGDVIGFDADLSVGAPEALGDDFTSSTGAFILATPTNGEGADENSGIWFLDVSSGAPAPGLSLPVLPSGWVYEGWAVINGTPVTTGRFIDTLSADRGAPFSGPMSGPPFPGEDFLVNAPAGLSFPTDLAGTTAVISIEPEPDDSNGPFTFKPLVSQIPPTAVDRVTLLMENRAAGLPTGTAHID